MLVHLNIVNARTGHSVQADLRRRRALRDQAALRRPEDLVALVKAFFWRLREKYVIRDFHPLVFFYTFGIVMSLAGLGLGIALVVLRALGHDITAATGVLVALLLIFGSQFTLFAMWFDMESNSDLR